MTTETGEKSFTPLEVLGVRQSQGISVTAVDVRRLEGLLLAVVSGHDRAGRAEVAIATTPIGPDPLANEDSVTTAVEVARALLTAMLTEGVGTGGQETWTVVPGQDHPPVGAVTGNPAKPRPDATYAGYEADEDGPYHLWRVGGVLCSTYTAKDRRVVLRSHERCHRHADQTFTCELFGPVRWRHHNRVAGGVCERAGAAPASQAARRLPPDPARAWDWDMDNLEAGDMGEGDDWAPDHAPDEGEPNPPREGAPPDEEDDVW